MLIDWHAHVIPPEAAAAPVWRGNCPMAIDRFMEAHRAANIDVSVVTETGRGIKSGSIALVQQWSDYAARLQADYPGILYGFASVDPCGGKPHLQELERAITQLGLKGVLILSSHNDRYPDEDDAMPFWEMVQALDIPVMIHPSVADGEGNFKGYRLANSIGRPFDTALAIARLIVRGVLERYPDLKIVGAHLGGGICEVIGRMDYAYELRDPAHDFMGPYTPVHIPHPPSHYLKKLYLDTVSYHSPAIRCAIDTIGVDRVLLGSDAPPLATLKPRAIALIDELNLAPDDKAKVLGRTAAALLKIAPAAGSRR